LNFSVQGHVGSGTLGFNSIWFKSMNSGDTRQQLRAKRRSLSTVEQRSAGASLVSNLRRETFFMRAKRVAIYLANDGEIDPAQLLDTALKSGKQCFLPVLHPMKTNSLYFIEYTSKTQLVANKFGILEPAFNIAQVAVPWSLYIVFMPLVGFDRQGNRMGMGGGYYDRTLAFMNVQKKLKPKLVGLAHSCQEVDLISHQSWDIPLHLIATDREIICAKQK
jgi:5-formyltetrahydrofolate cyclo-ligase